MTRSTRQILHASPLVCMDIAFAATSFLLAYTSKFGGFSDDIYLFMENQSFQPYIPLLVFSPVVRVLSCNLLGVYRADPRADQAFGGVFMLFKAVTLGSVILMIIAFLYRGAFQSGELSYSRQVFLMDWLINLFLIVGTHSLIWITQDELRARGIGLRRIAVQGTGERARDLMGVLARRPELGYSVAGFIASEFRGSTLSSEGRSFKYLGDTKSLLHIINEHKLCEIVVTNVKALGCDLQTFVGECQKRDVIVKYIPDFYGMLVQTTVIEELAGQPAVQINEIAITGLSRILKRLEDIVLAIFGLIIVSPIMLITATLIKVSSKGPSLFKQERVGKNGRVFTLYKFRSMSHDAETQRETLSGMNESDGLLFKMKKDPRITFIGKIIRKTCIDELPQLLNVLRGDMSLIGPRPLPASDVQKSDDWKHRRLAALPGITGMWQVNRSVHTEEEMMKWDIYYIENWSLWLDTVILFKTVYVVLIGKGAY